MDIGEVAQFLEVVHNIPPGDRSEESFVRLVWEQNQLTGLGHGDYPLEDAYKDAGFRDEFAKAVNQTLPQERQQRLEAINKLVSQTQHLAQQFIKPNKAGRKDLPTSKTLRALTALLPFDLTPPSYPVNLNKLAIAMDLPSISRNTKDYRNYAAKSRKIIDRLDEFTLNALRPRSAPTGGEASNGGDPQDKGEGNDA